VPIAATSSLGNGAVFLISAYGVYEVIAANCSSPQTTELNADKRAETLMKWVHLGIAQSAVLVAIAVAIDRAHAVPIVAGAVLAAGFMEASYWHAKKSGLENPGTPTETW
jgi:hypothetical protein